MGGQHPVRVARVHLQRAVLDQLDQLDGPGARRVVRDDLVGITIHGQDRHAAALIELQPAGSQRAPLVTSAFSTLGLALGALITSALAQYAPAPARLIWWALLAVFAAGIVAVLAMGEPGTRRPGADRRRGTRRFGLHSTALVYSASLAALVTVAAGILLFRPSGQPARPVPASPAVMPPVPCTSPPCPQAVDPPPATRHP